jgi:LDH2 family malate/lactate/ureidoglycolate dehydrogenase
MGTKQGADKVTYKHEVLERFCGRVFEKLGLSTSDATIAASALVAANLRGVDTHGVLRLPFYAAKLREGYIDPRATLQTLRETAATALVDGRNGLGQVIGTRAMQTAIDKARAVGVSYVAVRNSNHFGTCAHYAMMAIPHDMIGIALTNGQAHLAPTGGAAKLLGNNPWSVAVPAGKRLPVVLDMANSVVAMGKVRSAIKEGMATIPRDWALNREGEPTTDPQEALHGILLPVGGYKGYGVTLMMDLLSGVLANSAFGPRVKGTDTVVGFAGVGHAFMAVNIAAFDAVATFKARMDAYIDEIKGVRKAKGVAEIYLPGELEFIKEEQRRREGIPLPPNVVEELLAVGKEIGIYLK